MENNVVAFPRENKKQKGVLFGVLNAVVTSPVTTCML